MTKWVKLSLIWNDRESFVEESKQLGPPRKLVLAKEQESTGELHEDPLMTQLVYGNYIIKKGILKYEAN